MVDNEEILKEIRGLKKESLIKDVLLVMVPLLVAGMSIYFSNATAQMQIQLAQNQLAQTQEIENAKLLEGFSQRILNGGRQAKLAQVALDYITLSNEQKSKLAKFFEQEAGGSDQPNPPSAPPGSPAQGIDQEFQSLLGQIFAVKINIRAAAYTLTKSYLVANYSNELVTQMASKVRSDPFNINGRSNVLSILAAMPEDSLRTSKGVLEKFIEEFEHKGAINPSYAVGPQTKGWISEIRAKIA
jgi:hypothetical protein